MNQNVRAKLLEKIRTYRMPKRAIDLLSQHPPLVLAGTTGSGKNEVAACIGKESDYRHVITHTTRPPRPDEQNGQNYWFVSEEKMLDLLSNLEMIEAKLIHGQQVSGTSIAAFENVIKSGRRPLLIIDVQGIEEIHKSLPNIRPVFLLPPSVDSWMQRLEKRGRMSHAERLRRMSSARQELKKALSSNLFFLVVNQEVPEATRAILSGRHDLSTQPRNRQIALNLLDHLKTI